MAEGKKSFLIYCDTIHMVRKLTNEQAGELFKHLLAYVNDEHPVTENPIVDIAFEPIKQQLKRDLKKYESIKLARSEAGKASAAKKAEKQQMSTSVESVEQNQTNSTVIDTVIDTVTDIKESKTDESVLPTKNKFEFVDSLITEFKSSYEISHGSTYEILAIGKERKSMAKILTKFKEKRPGLNSEQTKKELRAYFNLCNSIDDTWLNQNMSLSILVSKFNEINNILRNGIKRKTNQPATSDRELAELTAKHFASDYKRE